MERYTRISIPLGKDEYAALLEAAMSEYRHPRDQARAILRKVLIGNEVEEKHNGTGSTLQSETGAVAAVADDGNATN